MSKGTRSRLAQGVKDAMRHIVAFLQRVMALVRSVFKRIPWRRLLAPACLTVSVGVVLLGIVLILNGAVCRKVEDRIVTTDALLAMDGRFDYVIVLGCKVHDDGRLSDRLHDRVETGVAVYRTGIADALLMSGDRQTDGSYDEVGAMQAAAISWGVADANVLVDPVGYSTYESMRNLARVFAGKRVVIVTQEYHLYRALYIAQKLGMDAYGVSADRRSYSDQLKCEVRELLARVKDIWYTEKYA